VTSFFDDWYQLPTKLDPAATALSTVPLWWKELLSPLSATEDSRLHPNSKIPDHLQHGLRKVCAVKATDKIREDIQVAVDTVITFEEFSLAIDELKADSAPGLSESTPNMFKAWNPAVRQFIYKHMTHIWQARFCPTWFKDKIIKLAPKVPGSNDLNHMRPISLYEVIRKVWTTTVARRIHLVWHHSGILNPAQYGYRLDNGILMPLYNLLNAIERAHSTDTPTLLTFWDMRRAFDSIPRNLQRLAWIRLGVPDYISEWFVSLDEGGLAFVDTPYFQAHKDLRSASDMRSSPKHFTHNDADSSSKLFFIPQRGIGQGECQFLNVGG